MPELLVFHKVTDNNGLHRQKDGQTRFLDRQRISHDTVNGDIFAGVGFQEYIDIDLAGIGAGQNIKDAALRRNDGYGIVVLG